MGPETIYLYGVDEEGEIEIAWIFKGVRPCSWILWLWLYIHCFFVVVGIVKD